MFIIHSTTLLYHLPYLVRCEPRGSQHIRFRRRTFEEIRDSVSNRLFRCAYRMSKSSFENLHSIIQHRLEEEFLPRGGGACGLQGSSYIISTKIRLSIALRFFAGGAIYDIMLVHGVSSQSVYDSVWGVIDVINNTPELDFHFPSKEQQHEIAAGFCARSGAGFDNVVGAIDGLVICTLMPSLSECEAMNCGQSNFRCHRKDKYGLNLQAICDHNLKFTWIEMKWPAATSDYMAWVTSSLAMELEDDSMGMLIKGGTLVGDCAYVKKLFMATPLKGYLGGYEDGYNFYLSQLRITIERAFGVLVHRWAILRAPLICPIAKVSPLVLSLVRLHNFCIDQNELTSVNVPSNYRFNLLSNVTNAQKFGSGANTEIVEFDALGRPVSLLGCCHHFDDAEKHRRAPNVGTPMDDMIQRVKDLSQLM